MPKKKLIKEILTKDVISVPCKTSVLEAVSLMDKNEISCLIVAEDKRPVGIFTERDVVFAASKGDRFENMTIDKLMSKPVMTIRSETNIYEAYNFMLRHRMRHLVVVDSNGELAGVVTQTDILNTLIDIAVSGMWDESSNLVGFVAMAQDITERKEMEEKLLSLERIAAVGKISGGIAHEIRNPLSVIEGVVYLLKTKLTDMDEETYTYLDRLEIQANRITETIKSLQSLTEMEDARKMRLDLAEAVEVALDRARIPISIKVIKEVPKERFIVEADKEQIAMVFTNIVLNAVDAMRNEGTLWIKADQTNEEEIEVLFKDTGCGIARENLKKVFQPLFSDKVKGMGFGLTLCQMIIEKHGGKIAVESEPGEGSTFTVKLPVYKESEK